MKIRLALLILFIACSAAQGHHSVGALFDRNTLIRFEVEIVDFQFINPHPFMTANRTDGSDELLMLDMDNRREFTQLGIDGETFLPGDKVVVGAFASHTNPATFYLAVIEHPRLGFRYETNVRRLFLLDKNK